MTATLSVLDVRRRYPDVRLHVQVISGTVSSGDHVTLRRRGRMVGEGVVAALRLDRPDASSPRVLRAVETGQLFFKKQIELDAAEQGDTGTVEVVDDEPNARRIERAVRADLAGLDPTRPSLLLPMRIETRFEDAQGGRVVLKVRAWPDALHVRMALPMPDAAAGAQDERLRAAFAANPDQAAARDALETTVGPAEARRILEGTVGDGPPALVALPERLWIVARLPDGQTVEAMGRRLPESLRLPFEEAAAEEIPSWMRDYSDAERLGLGVTLDWPSGAARSVARLDVVGLPREGMDSLRDALDRRAATGSVRASGAGSPTKGRAMPDHPPASEGLDRLERLLGWRPKDGDSAPDLAAAAADLVWYAAAGPALRHGVLGSARNDPKVMDVLETLRLRFRDLARADGPMPTLVLDDIPFGLWPIMPGGDDPLAPPSSVYPAIAQTMREQRHGRRRAGPWQALVAALCDQEQGRRWQIRRSWEGLLQIHRLAAHREVDPNGAARDAASLSRQWGAAQRTAAAWTRGTLQPRSSASAALGVSERDAALLCGPLLMPDAEAGSSYAEHLAWIAERPASDLLKWKYRLFPSERSDDQAGQVASLAETLVVTALRDRLAAAAAAEQAGGDLAIATALHDAVAPGGADRSRGWRELVDRTLGLGAGGDKLSDWITITARASTAEAQEALNEALAVLKASTILGTAPAERAHRALAGALDLFSTRMDAWTTAAATARLDRAGTAMVGAYGMVEGIEPRTADPQPVRLAPGTDHASTAAILDAAETELAARGLGGLAEVRLPPARARVALEMASGLRRGLAPEEILGRAALRLVHGPDGPDSPDITSPLASSGELGEGLAETFPLEGTSGTATPASRIDGLALHTHLHTTDRQAMTLRLRGRDVPLIGVLAERLYGALEDMLGGYRDLLFAEAVHALGAGQPVRAKAALDALGFGGPVPGRFDVLEASPPALSVRTGLAILCNGPDDPGAEALADRLPAAAAAARALTGVPMGHVTARVGLPDGTVATRRVPLRTVLADPLAWIVLAAPGQTVEATALALCTAALADGAGELRILDPGRPDLPTGPRRPGDRLDAIRNRRDRVSGRPVDLDIIPKRPDRTISDVALDGEARDWLWAAGRAAEVLARARALVRSDLPGATADAPGAAVDRPSADHGTAARELVAALATAGPDTAPALLRRAGAGGFLSLLPAPLFEAGPQGLGASARALSDTMRARLEAGETMISLPLPTAPQAYSRIVKSVWLDAPPPALAAWIDRTAVVRPPLVPLRDLNEAGVLAEDALVALQWSDVTVGGEAADTFAGNAVDLSTDAETIEALLCLDAHGAAAARERPALAGFLIDRMGEEVARPERTAGLAFRHPGPTAQAPQAILAVVLPEGLRHSPERLIEAVELAFDMSIARGVALGDLPAPEDGPPDVAAGLGQLLPLLWVGPGDGGEATCDFGSVVELG